MSALLNHPYAAYNKAIVPVVVGVILYVGKALGVAPDASFSDVVTLLVTSALVFFVPNKK